MTAVFILRHDAAASAAMQARLESTPRIRVAGAARQCFVARELLPDSGAELLLADLLLPDGSAMTLLHELPLPRPKLLLLTRSVDDALLLEALRAGADGYWLEGDPAREVDLAIAETMRDEAVMAPPIARQVTGYFSAGGARLQPLQLTDVDRELLLRLGRGQSPSDIARAQGGATASDVRRRIRQIYRKMQWDLRSWERAAA
jgi:DNA-binding NarL/FixJ family response regulator